ncbi:MAG: MTH938/NDUFAF3 family protein [Planctomycetaceae bacterium]
MKWGKYRFGSIKIDGKTYEKDLVLDRGGLRQRKKKPSRAYRDQFGHTPVSLKEEIPWKCKCLVIGTGMDGQLPVMDEVVAEAQRRGVEIVICPTPQAIQQLQEDPEATNAILHVTC